MTYAQWATLAVLAVVIAAMLSERVRADVAALAGAAALVVLGLARPEDLQNAFASPALIALACLFIMARALQVTGVIGVLIGGAGHMASRWGVVAAPTIITLSAGLSAFVNNTPIVVLAAPILRDLGHKMGWSPKQLLMPLSYAAVLGGCLTLIGTSTNLLVDEMAQKQGLRPFGLFEITGVGLALCAAGGLYLATVGRWLLPTTNGVPEDEADAHIPPLRPLKALITILLFAGVIAGATMGISLPVLAFPAAVLLVVLRVLTPTEAYSGLKPDILLMIAGMLVIGSTVERSGLALLATEMVAQWTAPFGPLVALAAIYLVTSLLTEVLSNAAVAVLMTPLAIALATNLGVDARALVVAVMMAASASFATPFGYQTNAIVYSMGRYRYMDFVRVGLPLNIITWLAAMWAIPRFFPLTPG